MTTANFKKLSPQEEENYLAEIAKRYRFAANDPRFKQALKYWKMFPYLRLLYRFIDFYNLVKAYDDAPILGVNHNGFTLRAGCQSPRGGPSAQTYYSGYSGPSTQFDGYASSCLLNQAITPIPYNQAVPANIGGLVGYCEYGVPNRYQLIEHWFRPRNHGEVYPVLPLHNIQPVVAPLANPLPELYPTPAVKPFRVPFRILPLIKSPFKESGYEYETANQNKTNLTAARPSELVISGGGTARPRVAVRPSQHSNTPPPSGVKENKVKSAAGKAMSIMANAVTETQDFVDSLWQALPARMREHGYSGHMQDKLQDLYNHWHDVNVPKALKNVAYNQLEDMAYGYLPSKYGAKVNQGIYNGRDKYVSRGVMTGNSRRQSYY